MFQYLGSTLVKELRGTESTKKSIQKLKRAVTSRENKQTPDVVLSISYRGVQFLDATTKVSARSVMSDVVLVKLLQFANIRNVSH